VISFHYYDRESDANDNTFANCTIRGAAYLFRCDRTNYGNMMVNSIVNDVRELQTGTFDLDFDFAYTDFWSIGFTVPAGDGNISLEPLFADTANSDFHLKSAFGRWDPAAEDWIMDDVTSPAIDAGDPDSSYANEPQGNGDRINLGMYGNTVYASRSSVPTGTHNDPAAVSENLLIFPNQFTQGSAITFLSRHSSPVCVLRIFTIEGVLIKDFSLPPGSPSRKINWNPGNMSPGNYFIQIENGKHIVNRKISLAP
jgi:hypothetical protein